MVNKVWTLRHMADTHNMDGPPPAIPARSKRQAMDWSLVLASQGITAIIRQTETGWELIVDEPEHGRAGAVISQYQIENRAGAGGGRWRGAALFFTGAPC